MLLTLPLRLKVTDLARHISNHGLDIIMALLNTRDKATTCRTTQLLWDLVIRYR